MAAKIRMPSICFSLTAITEYPRDEVTQRFPDGLTVWQAEGQWQTAAGSIDREQSKVLLLVHGDTAAVRQSVQAVHPGVPQDVRSAIGSVGKRAGLRRDVGAY